MRKDEYLRRLFNERLSKATSDLSFWAVVKSVDEEKRTCVVADDIVHYEDVLLYSIEKKDKGIFIFPKIDSSVIVSRVAGSSVLYVSIFSVIDKLEIDIEETIYKMDAEGHVLEKGSSGLKKTLSELCDAIGRLTVTTSMGPSGTPINATEFSTIKSDLNNYLK